MTYLSKNDLSRPYLASRALVAAGEMAFSERKGPPGTMFIRQKVMVATAQMVTIARRILLAMYFPNVFSPI